MNFDSPQNPREKLEASLTSLLLGELSHEEAAALHEKLARDPELAALYERLKETAGVVRETMHSPAGQTAEPTDPLKLSEERRQKLFAHFKTVAPKEFEEPKRQWKPRWIEVAIAASFIGILGALLIPSLRKMQSFGVGGLAVQHSSSAKEDIDYSSHAVGYYNVPTGSGGKSATADQSPVPTPAPAAPQPGPAATTIVLPQSGQPSDLATLSGSQDQWKTFDGSTGPAVAFDFVPMPKATAAEGDGVDKSFNPAKSANNTWSFAEPKFAKSEAGILGPKESASTRNVPDPATLTFDDTFDRNGREIAANSAGNRSSGGAFGGFGPDARVATNAIPIAYARATSLTNIAGVPDWIGRLQGPVTPRQMENQFIGSYAYVPPGQKTDVDAIHETSTVMEALSSKTVSGYVDTTMEWNPSTGNAGAPKPVGAGNSYNENVLSFNTTPDTRGASNASGVQNKVPELGDLPTLGALYRGQPGVPASPTSPPQANMDLGVAKVTGSYGGGGPAVVTLGGNAGTSDSTISAQSLRSLMPAPVASPRPKDNDAVNEPVFRSANHTTKQLADKSNASGVDASTSAAEKGPLFVATNFIVAGSFIVLPASSNDSKVASSQDRSVADREKLVEAINNVRPAPGGVEQVENSGFVEDNATLGKPREMLNFKTFNLENSPNEKPATTQQLAFQNGIVQKSEAVTALPRGGTQVDRKQTLELAANERSYSEAESQLEELKRFRQILDTKIAGEKEDVDLPKSTMVEIVDKAVPPTKESSSLWDKIRGDKSKAFRSSARVKMERDQSDIAGLADRGTAPSYDPYFIQTEFEAIESGVVLGKVVKDLKLNEAWEKKEGGKPLTTEETVKLLKKQLELKPVRNTSMIEIGVRSDNPDEAAKIANAVTEAYVDRRKQQREELSHAEMHTLEQRFAEQEAKVREAQSNVDQLRAKLNVSDSTIAAAHASNQKLATEIQDGKLLFEVEQYEQAEVKFREALRKNPNDQAALYYLSLCADAMDAQAPRTHVPTNAPPQPATPPLIPQPEVQAAENVFSTFSLNVSDVSFKLAAASLEKSQMPDAGAVRSEEFINAFDYRDPEPPAGVPVAFAWERAQYPFAQNRDLLRFSLKTAALGREPGKPLNIVLLLDNSGSMERADRVQIIHEALRVLASQLQPQDKLSIVTFARTARLFADGISGEQAAQVVEQVSGLTPEGGTNLEEAMNLAYETALRHYLPNGVNRVVLLTDGAANLGEVEPATLKQKVEAHRKQGVALDCFGIGWEGFNDNLLEQLSRNGDGRYGFINTPEEASTEFAGQLAGALHVAASDVKVQVEFNPARVTAWRQIGYAKHQLTKEQFRDNTVDAAEIGAAESGNALYVIQVNPAGEGPLATVRVRYKVPGTTDYREHEWPVPYTGNAVALEQASPAMRLAATASAFSEWLASSPYAGEVTPDRLLGYLSGVPELYGADARPKKLEWMIRQAESISEK